MKRRERAPAPPRGKAMLRWLGPGLLWMLSAVGTGSILFTPRVAALYRYQLLWLLLLVIGFMWVMIREMARFPIVTGRTVLDGMHALPGPRNWAVWVIFVPQLAAAAAGIAGLSAIVGSALIAVLPGPGRLYAIATVIACALLTSLGQYRLVERVSRYMAVVLFALALVSAARVFPSLDGLASGLRFGWPADADLAAILPWVGTILAGSMGIVWFGYWIATRGYGGGLSETDADEARPAPGERRSQEEAVASAADTTAETTDDRINAWIHVMSGAAGVGVLGGGLVIAAFLVLGAELLAPAGIVPRGADVAVDLTRLFSDIWGAAGKFAMLAAVVIALGGSVLANQDGWGRSFADMTLILLGEAKRAGASHPFRRLMDWLQQRTRWQGTDRSFLERLYIVVFTGLAPLVILLLFADPVAIMAASGIIAAAHTPFIVFTALAVNLTQLPGRHRPGVASIVAMVTAGCFYLGFAVMYLTNV